MDSFGSRPTLRVGNPDYEIYRLDALDKKGISTQHLPYSLRILLENLLRTEDGGNVSKADIRALASWNSKSKPEKEIAFTPSRVLLQDFTGVPVLADLAAMRSVAARLGQNAIVAPHVGHQVLEKVVLEFAGRRDGAGGGGRGEAGSQKGESCCVAYSGASFLHFCP